MKNCKTLLILTELPIAVGVRTFLKLYTCNYAHISYAQLPLTEIFNFSCFCIISEMKTVSCTLSHFVAKSDGFDASTLPTSSNLVELTPVHINTVPNHDTWFTEDDRPVRLNPTYTHHHQISLLVTSFEDFLSTRKNKTALKRKKKKNPHQQMSCQLLCCCPTSPWDFHNHIP